jgi:DNA polymerase-4
VSEDLVRKGYVGKTIGVKLRFEDFRTVTRDHTLERATDQAADIRRAAADCIRRVPLERRLRLLGIRVGALSRPGADTAEQAPATGDLFQ